MSCEEQRDEEIQRAPENKPKRGHQQRESELQRIRESRRFVGRKEEGKHLIREEFLTFVHACKGTNAEELTTKFLETIQSVGLSVNDMRAQGYDGASVMSGHVSGVQTRIR